MARRQRAPTIDRLGSGSDYTGPFDHVGVPSLEAGYTSPSGEYHSAYDDTYQLEHFLDPGYVHEAAAAKVLGVTALRLANADVYPLRYSDYATAVRRLRRRPRRRSSSSPAPRRST